MANEIVDALERVFQEVRDRDISLAERLSYFAGQVRAISPPFADAVETFVRRLQDAGAGKGAPQVGDLMPNFMLPDDEGHLVSLDRLLEHGPVAVVFLRGHWCPYCRLNAVGLAEIQTRIKPVQIVAISAQTQAFSRTLRSESGANFPFLTDFANGYALSLSLAIWVDEAMSSIIAGSGWDVSTFQGDTGWVLPIPSTFLVGQDGLIKARHVDADYRRRFEPSEILAAANLALA